MVTHTGPDILDSEIKWALQSTTDNKAGVDDGIKDDATRQPYLPPEKSVCWSRIKI